MDTGWRKAEEPGVQCYLSYIVNLRPGLQETPSQEKSGKGRKEEGNSWGAKRQMGRVGEEERKKRGEGSKGIGGKVLCVLASSLSGTDQYLGG